MAFIAQVLLPAGAVPELAALLEDVEREIDLDLVLDEQTLAAQLRERREGSSWCPWPSPQLSVYVEGASTRGVDLSAVQKGSEIDLRVTVPVLATWTDWELGIRLEPTFLTQDRYYLDEIEEGWSAIGTAIAQGRRVRIGGPAGYASIGAYSWRRLREGSETLEEEIDLALRLVTMIQASIEVRGFESFAEANPMVLEGPGNRRVIASLLAPGQDIILRDPEFILLSADIEADDKVELMLLPFDRFEDAFPALGTWLDDRCCAVPAIPKESWSQHIQRIHPLLISVPDLLDTVPDELSDEEGPELDSIPFPSFRTEAPAEDRPRRKWWKLW